jgi:hypothetical protein
MRRFVNDDRSDIAWCDIGPKEVARIELTSVEGCVVTPRIPPTLDAYPDPSQIAAKTLVTTRIVSANSLECLLDPLISDKWVRAGRKGADPESVNETTR